MYSICKQKGVLESVPDSFPGSSQTSLSSVWFAGATPELRSTIAQELRLETLKKQGKVLGNQLWMGTIALSFVNYCGTIASLLVTPFALTPIPLL